MATSGNNREVKLSIIAGATGIESVKALKDAVAGLAKEGGEAAPEFTRLAAELDKVSSQQAAIDRFVTLRREIVDVGTALTTAASQVDRLGSELPAAAAKTALFAQANSEVKASLEGQRAVLSELQSQYAQLKDSTVGAARDTLEYRTQSGLLAESIKVQRGVVSELSSEQREVAAQTRAAAKEEKDLTSEYEKSLNTAKQLSREYAARNTQLSNTREALRAEGIETNNLLATQEKLKGTFDSLATSAKLQAEVLELSARNSRDLAAAQRLLDTDDQMLTTQRSAQLRREQAAALELAERSTRQLAAAEKLLQDQLDIGKGGERVAQEHQLAAAREASERATRQLALAEKLLQAELEIESASKREAITLENQRIAAVTAGADAIRKAAAESAEALNNAFAKTGVRAAEAIELEIKQIDAALVKLASDTRVSGQEFDRAFQQGTARIAALRGEIAGVTPEIDKTGGALNYLKQQASQLAAIYGGIQLGQQFLNATIQFETATRSLTSLTGSAQIAAAQIQALRTTANNAGVSVGGITDSFIRFNASMLSSGQSLTTTNDLFNAVTSAGGRLGLSSDRVSLSLEALGQIASKGVVSMEELRGQLGDSFPGALAITAKALGLSTQQLIKLVESGKLLSEDLLPALIPAMNSLAASAKPIDGLAAAWNRLKNAATETAQQANDTAPYRALVSVIGGLANNFQTVVDVTYSLGKAFVAFKAIGIVTEFLGIKAAAEALAVAKARETLATEAGVVAERSAAVATRASAVAKEVETVAITTNTAATIANTAAKTAGATSSISLGNVVATTFDKGAVAATGMAARVGSLASALGGPYGIALTAAIAFSDQLGNGLAKLAAKITGVEGELKKNEAALKAQDDALAQSIKRAEEGNAGFAKLQAGYTELSKALENVEKVAKKDLETSKLRGEVMVRLAELSGNEMAALQASSAAKEADVEASKRLVSVSEVQLQSLEAQRDEFIALAGGIDKLSTAKRQQLVEIDQSIAKQRAETDGVKAAASAVQDEAASRRIALQTYKDNSGALVTLKADYDRAALAAKTLVEGNVQIGVSGGQSEVALRKAGEAARLYADALKDSAAKLTNQIAINERAYESFARKLNLDIERSKLAEQEIRQNGDMAVAMAKLNGLSAEQAELQRGGATLVAKQIEQRNLQIQSVNNYVAKINEQIALEKQQVDIFIAEQKARGTLPELIDREVAARRAAIAARVDEVAAAQNTIKSIELEKKAIQDKSIAQTIANNLAAQAAATAGANAAAALAAAQKQKEADLLSQGIRTTADGKNAQDAGNVSAANLASLIHTDDAATLLSAKLKEGNRTGAPNSGITEADRTLIEAAYKASVANLQMMQNNRNAFSLEGQRGVETRAAEARRAMELLNSAPVKAQPTAATQATATGYSVTITLPNGTKQTINAANQTEAKKLVDALTSLGKLS